MLVVSLLVVACMGLGVCAVYDVADFDDEYAGYEIIFHDGHDLMIVIHGNKCYYVYTPDSQESHLVQGSYIVQPLQKTEGSLLQHIWRNSSGEVTSSSLAEVRDRFKDLLANYHCQDKEIYQVQLFSSTKSGTSNNGTGTSSSSNSGNLHSLCHGFTSGRYPYPDDCHKFVTCSNWQTFVEHCPAGTAFLSGNLPCVPPSRVPGCH